MPSIDKLRSALAPFLEIRRAGLFSSKEALAGRCVEPRAGPADGGFHS